jgi:carbonic anhydrase
MICGGVSIAVHTMRYDKSSQHTKWGDLCNTSRRSSRQCDPSEKKRGTTERDIVQESNTPVDLSRLQHNPNFDPTLCINNCQDEELMYWLVLNMSNRIR